MPVVVPPKVTTRNSLKLSFQVTGNSKVEGAPAKLPIPYTGRKKINYESFPFDVPFWEDYNPIVSDFEDWLQIGLYIKPKKSESGTLFYYKKSSRILRQEFDFNVTTIDQKDWFLKLAMCHTFFESTHIDVLFYYLRKMDFHSRSSVVESVTTSDSFFHQRMINAYDKFLSSTDSRYIIHPDNDIIDYMSGFNIICGMHWTVVDHVLMPIHTQIDGVEHWILGRFSINERILYIYNSLRSHEIDAQMLKAVESYSVMLPQFLSLIGLEAQKKDLFIGDGAYVGKNWSNSLDVVFVDDLPTQEKGDCGAFVVAFAEHFMKGLKIPSQLDAKYIRNRYAYFLYEHGWNKLAKGYESEDLFPGNMPDDSRMILYNDWLNM
ncbi:UB-like protease 1A [Striga asiatica]|uniref:UB-like protease 1A n=1 Tax=Striga asiatica TaxID=4170 RepID=A0A5A7Q0M6_STRAF|nr:UB-like protease 1A [Striga asiatica]